LAGGFVDNKPVKKKKCRICGDMFRPFSTTSVVCSTKCAFELTYQNREKEFKQETKRLKEKIRIEDRPYWLKKAQDSINKYVRLRDKGEPCISCDKPDNGQRQRHASHFKSVGSNSALRFNLWNIHASCSVCNNHLSGNIGEYIPRLIEKIGQEKYDWLQAQNQPIKYEIDYLKRLRRIFNKRARIVEKRYN
jgi:hypothetical protein